LPLFEGDIEHSCQGNRYTSGQRKSSFEIGRRKPLLPRAAQTLSFGKAVMMNRGEKIKEEDDESSFHQAPEEEEDKQQPPLTYKHPQPNCLEQLSQSFPSDAQHQHYRIPSPHCSECGDFILAALDPQIPSRPLDYRRRQQLGVSGSS
jgi:hypothetical protein